jgi:XkdW protein.
MDKVEILKRRFPGAEWVLRGDDLEWLDDSPAPTEAELDALWSDVQAEIEAEQQARVDAKASAISKLEALGLTVDEIKEAFGLET